MCVYFCEERSLQKKVDTQDELPVRILDAAVCIKKREDHVRQTSDPHTRVTNFFELTVGI